ncbi:helix-turn-helix transcriptional regulator [Kitasatospora sp. NPDC004669]|uniref:helix-turn-helix transcriptional regulator n=1 Tax=Kitasatospora sp. NPDC004669 TaxID=3154555 RepID=UPI0033AFA8C6
MNLSAELSEFLRTRRARLRPEEVGVVPVPGVRRVAGLRREELAQLAGISVDYYTRVEQGRIRRVSDSVIESLAGALRLDQHEQEHFRNLAQPPRQASREPGQQRVRPGLRIMLDALTDVPAYIVGRRLDVLAWNEMARALVADFPALTPKERNLARLVFLDERAREIYPEWEHIARNVVGNLRLEVGRHFDDIRLAGLVGDLSLRSPEFRSWWAGHDVKSRTFGTKTFRHPEVGLVRLHFSTFQLAEDPEQKLIAYAAEAGSDAATALRLLASWNATLAPRPVSAADPADAIDRS